LGRLDGTKMIKTIKLEVKIEVPNKIYNTKVDTEGDDFIIINNKSLWNMLKDLLLNQEIFSCSDKNEDYFIKIIKVIKRK
jgi:hypothetical protein